VEDWVYIDGDIQGFGVSMLLIDNCNVNLKGYGNMYIFLFREIC